MQKARILGPLLALIALLAPSAAQAQYKNSSFGLDVSYVLFPTLPSIYTTVNGNKNYIGTASHRPDRLKMGYRLGGEYNFKMHADHWWFNARIDATAYQFPGSTNSPDVFLNTYDATADATIGTLLGLDGMVGVKYFILTDHIRPYVELGLSVEHLFTFATDASATCTDNGLCPDQDTFGNEFLPHTTFLGLHARPGLEVTLEQDIMLHLYADVQDWVIFNADDNTVLTFGAGLTFY